MEGRSGFRKAKTYGKKASSFLKVNTAIFAVDFPPAQKASASVKPVTASPEDFAFPLPSIGFPARQPLIDVTNQFSKICLSDQEERVEVKTRGKGKEVEKPRASRVTRSASAVPTSAKRADQKYKWLEPLTTVYARKGRKELTLQRWQDVLSEGCSVEKIAESSYAEVFKIRNDQGNSVLKLMALKPPTGRGSRRETAVTADSIVSEVFIMDLMADIPGFLEFKEAWVIEGQPSPQIIAAFEKFEAVHTSDFTHPAKYPKDQVFLALELGDAGVDIEHYKISTLSQVWDVFLKVTAALAIGEREYAFEVSLAYMWTCLSY
jgi:serine/threonine-protein kinase haspin